MASNSSSWIIGLILSIGGIFILFMPWFEANVLFTSVSYDAFDMAFGDPFQKGGFWENFDGLGRFCPLIFGILSVLNVIIFAIAREKKASVLIFITSTLMIILPIYVMTCINPGSGTGWRRAVGSANYVGILIGVISLVAGYISNKK